MTGPDRIWATEDKENFGEDRFHSTFPMKGLTEYIRRDPAVLAALPEVQAMIAAAYEVAAQTVATQGDSSATEALGQRICCSGHMCGCQGATVEDWLLHLIRAITPADATAALAARDAAIIARGMREAATLLREQGYGTAPKQILARAAEIERDAK